MSGLKQTTVTTTQQHLDQLNRQVAERERRVRKAQEQMREAEKRHQNNLSEIQRQNQEIQKQHANDINGLRSDLKEAEQMHQQRLSNMQNQYDQALIEQSKDFQKRLKTQADEIGKEIGESEKRTDVKITNVRKELNTKLDNQRKEYLEITQRQQQQIRDVDNEVQKIKHKDAFHKQTVSDRLNDLATLTKNFERDYPDHNRWSPGKLDKIQNTINRAIDDLNKREMAEAANAMMWDAYDRLNDLRDDVIKKKSEFEREYQLSLQYLEILLDIARDDKMDVDNINKGLIEEEKKIDFWTNGQFQKLKEELTNVEEQLKNGKDNLNMEDLKNLNQQLGEIEENQKKAINLAISNVLASHQRVELAKNVANQLRSIDYQVVDGNGFEGDDPRNPYMVRVRRSKDPKATETVVLIAPKTVSETTIENNLILNHNDFFPDEESARQEYERVTKAAFNQNEVSVGQTSCVAPKHIPELIGENVKESLKPGKSIPENVKKQL